MRSGAKATIVEVTGGGRTPANWHAVIPGEARGYADSSLYESVFVKFLAAVPAALMSEVPGIFATLRKR